MNRVSDTTMPADLATKQATLDGIDEVGIVAWTGAESFQNEHLVEVHSLDVPTNQLRITTAEYRNLKKTLRRYDIAHIHHNHSGFYAKLAARRLGMPIVTTEHNDHDGFTQKGRIANGLTNPLADEIVCVSGAVRDSFKRWEDLLISDDKTSVVYNGVDMERMQTAQSLGWSVFDVADIQQDAILVGSAGRLVEQKGYDVLIDAVDRVNQRSERPVELVISGEGASRSMLEDKIASAKSSESLHLLGFLEQREQVFKMMDECDLFSMPSRWEGYCISVMEAMAQGTPCVLSSIDVFREVYGDAAMYHPVNDVETLSNRILSLAENPGLREEYREKGLTLSEDHTFSKTAKEYVDIYQEAVA